MSMSIQAQELRRLLILARKLRRLADETGDADGELFVAAAAALEARANWMASSLPGTPYDPAAALHLHERIDVLA